MPESYKRIYQGQLTTSATAVYTVPSATDTIIKSIRIANTTANSTTVKLWNGGSGDANVILPAVTIDAGGFAEFDGTLTMNAADTLHAQAGANSTLTMSVYGVEIT